mgnify:CR=1 FL=1
MGVVNERILKKDAFKVVGIEFDFQPDSEKPSENMIANTWSEFDDQILGIQDVVTNHYFGIISYPENWKPGDAFKYMVCVKVKDFPLELPEGMVQKEIPSHHYAVLTYQGVIDKIKEASDYLFSNWAPTIEGFTYSFPYFFEYYGEDFTNNNDPNSIFELWVPLMNL